MWILVVTGAGIQVYMGLSASPQTRTCGAGVQVGLDGLSGPKIGRKVCVWIHFLRVDVHLFQNHSLICSIDLSILFPKPYHLDYSSFIVSL